jgi:peptidyl-dipeptidase A
MRTFPLVALFAASSLAAQARPAQQSEAERFLSRAERILDSLSVRASRAQWVQQNFITDDTEILNAEAGRDLAVAVQQLATEAKKYDVPGIPAATKRRLLLLKLSLSAPPPADGAKATELSNLGANLDATYGKGEYCKPGVDGAKKICFAQQDISRILATSRNNTELVDAWRGWHAISIPMKDKYTRFVELSNEGARGLGFADAGAMWRSGYDMPPDSFAVAMDRAWNQLRPLYLSLHAYVRTKLVQKYGAAVVKPDGPIPTQLLGNIWAQDWSTIYDLVAPPGGGASVDVTALLKAKSVDELGMVKYAEGFFTSLGFPKLPDSFWTRSLFLKPQDRDVVCHASAWDVDSKEDLRIKMCIERTAEMFSVVHHELGHNFYQRAYNKQPFFYQNGANDGFHEAIGDAVALSITPKYLQQVGLLKDLPPASSDTLYLLQKALEKISFLPFGLLVDQWRWKVFAGEVKPAEYTKAWWDLKLKYQGIVPPIARGAADFDPGAKYHVAGNVPYARYFLAAIHQFQFYRSLCKSAGHTGPLYQCSFYGSKAAGEKFAKMLETGASKPWPETLEAFTGEKGLDATAMVEYFQPLKVWLDRQNAGKPVGW